MNKLTLLVVAFVLVSSYHITSAFSGANIDLYNDCIVLKANGGDKNTESVQSFCSIFK